MRDWGKVDTTYLKEKRAAGAGRSREGELPEKGLSWGAQVRESYSKHVERSRFPSGGLKSEALVKSARGEGFRKGNFYHEEKASPCRAR